MRTKKKTIQFPVIEGFSGPGGMSLGLTNAGMNPILAFDYDAPTVATYRHNLGEHGFQGDASQLSTEELREKAGLAPDDELFLFAGGPPCQGFSKQKRGAHLGDERNLLIFDYIRFVQELNPCFFLFENVAIFGQKRGREFLGQMQEQLSNYRITSKAVNAADFGLAQTRQRFIAVGVRRDLDRVFHFPKNTHLNWKTLGEVIRDLPSPPSDYSEHPEIANHQAARVTEKNVTRFSHVPPGGGWRDIPEHLRMPCHRRVDSSKGGWPDVFGRLRWDGQCPTITGGFDSFTRGRYGHPSDDRPLTPREAARIQGFPDSFIFQGSRGDVRSQIGNAVPPPLAEAIGRQIIQTFESAPNLETSEANVELMLDL